MPNRRTNRRKKYGQKSKNDKPTSLDIEKMVQEMNSSDTDPEMVKFLTYVMERKLYGSDCSNDFVIFCLSSYFILRNKYPPFSLMFDFPPKEFLEEETLKDFHFRAGITTQILSLLQIKTENYEPLAKICVLVMDEIVLKPHMKYSNKHDYVIGFEDNGKVRTKLPAQFVTNVWIHCVGGQWLIPLAYFFTNKSCTAADLKDYLFEAVSKLDEIGLDVIGVVTKMRSNFYELAQLLNISPANQSFKVGEREVAFFFDVPQLMNITRNNMMKYKFQFNGTSTAWKYVKQFFQLEVETSKDSKLSVMHVKPDMNQRSCCRYAIELLSNYVSTEMKAYISRGQLSVKAAGTAEYIDLMDKLFDVLNSSSEISMNEYCNAYRGTKHQTIFMEKMIKLFEDLRVFDSSNQDCTDQVKFINGWLISVKGVMKLWEMLSKRNYPFLLTRNINCESLDKFIWLLRWQIYVFKDPTPASFLEVYGSFFTSSYFEEQPLSDEFDIRDFSKKIYHRIPSVRHDVSAKASTDKSDPADSNKNAASSSTSEENPEPIFHEEFMKNFMELLGFE